MVLQREVEEMTIGVARISAEGHLILPPEVMDRLEGVDQFLVFQRDDTLLLKRIAPPAPAKRLSEIADRLAALNEIDPITPEEVEAEVQAYRAEKRAGKLENANSA